MCTPHEAAMIRQEAGQWMQRGKMFTSVDIANSLKQRGQFIRNREVASFLRKNAVDFSPQYGFQYTKTVINVTLTDGTDVPATLYHPMGTDPAAYTDRDQKAFSPDEAKNDNPTEAQDYSIPFPGPNPDEDETYDTPGYAPGYEMLQGLAPMVRPAQVVNIYISNVQTMIVSPSTPNEITNDLEMEEDEEDYGYDED